MQLSRPSIMQRLAFSRFIGLTFLYLGPLIKSFLKALFLMILFNYHIFLLFGFTDVSVFGIVIVSLKSMYATL